MPVRVVENTVVLIEVLAPHPHAFSDADSAVLQRLAETVIEAAHRAARVESLPFLKPVEKKTTIYQTGSVLFAAPDKKEETRSESSAEKNASGITLPRSHLILLVCAAATIMFARGFSRNCILAGKIVCRLFWPRLNPLSHRTRNH